MLDLQNEVAGVKQFVNYPTLACPPETQDNPGYKEIGNQCFYFQNTTFSHTQAQENCKDKLRVIGAGGKLFEPKTLAKNKAVAEAGQEFFGSDKWAYIGVDDVGNNKTLKYSTGEHFTSIQNPPWWSSSYPKGTGANCVSLYFHTNGNTAKWFDSDCGSRRLSVCEATLQLPDDS